MITLSAFADEVSPDPDEQIRVLSANGVRHIELRGVYDKNVLDLTDDQCAEFRSKLQAAGFGISAIGSPIGKVGIEDDFNEHLDRFRIAMDRAAFFNTPCIRLFSYYIPEGKDPADYRQAVMDRMSQKTELAAAAGLTLLHENESGIYGDTGDRCLDLLSTVDSPHLRGIVDFSNFVHCGDDPLACWPRLKPYTVYFHIKDYSRAEQKVKPAGEGDGSVEAILKDAVAGGFSGFCSLEPHLAVARKMKGFTGPDLFVVAADALKRILDRIGAAYN